MNSDIVDRLAFVLTQVRSQVERIRDDDNFYKLSDDAKLALGGIESNMNIHLSHVLDLLKNPKRVIEVLQAAFVADPNAIHSLIVNRVPCNQALADDPFVMVDHPPVLPDGNWQVGTLGLVNAVLSAYGLPRVMHEMSDEKDSNGRSKLIGFCEYGPSAMDE